MRLQWILLAGILSIVSLPVMAGGFKGIDASLAAAIQDISYGGGSQTNYGARGNQTEYFSTANKTNVTPNINVGYNFIPYPQFLIGLQAAAQPAKSSTAYVQKNPGTKTEYNINERYDASLLPGWLATPETLLYGKLGYSYAQRYVANVNGAWSENISDNGYVVGLGIKSLILSRIMTYQNVYIFAEYNYAGYGNRRYSVINTSGDAVVSSNLGLHINTGLLGIGLIL